MSGRAVAGPCADDRTGYLSGRVGARIGRAEFVVSRWRDAGAPTLVVLDDVTFLGSYAENLPIEVFEWPWADDEGPDGHTPATSPDLEGEGPQRPSLHLEHHFVPIIIRTEAFDQPCVTENACW